MNPPEENLALFERMLPYASALGLEKAWISTNMILIIMIKND